MMHPEGTLWWLALLGLGALHGLNPAMGWLFAVGSALMKRDRRALWRAFGPLAAGHALAICASVLLVLSLGRIIPLHWLRWLVADSLAVMGLDGLLRHRHVRLGGMRVSARQLAAWSFLMASVHGAGLMVLPFVLGASSPGAAATSLHHHATSSVPLNGSLLGAGLGDLDAMGLAAALIHTLGYVVVTVLLAVVVYEKVGLGILRRAWININTIWSVMLLVAAGTAVLV